MAYILLPDDDAGFHEGLAETLGDPGHRTCEVDSGERAFELIVSAEPGECLKFDLAFLDMQEGPSPPP